MVAHPNNRLELRPLANLAAQKKDSLVPIYDFIQPMSTVERNCDTRVSQPLHHGVSVWNAYFHVQSAALKTCCWTTKYKCYVISRCTRKRVITWSVCCAYRYTLGYFQFCSYLLIFFHVLLLKKFPRWVALLSIGVFTKSSKVWSCANISKLCPCFNNIRLQMRLKMPTCEIFLRTVSIYHNMSTPSVQIH